MEDFPNNSNIKKQTQGAKKQTPAKPEKKVEKIVQSEVVRRKKSLGKRFSEFFFQGDAKNAFSSVTLDVLVPAAKDTLADAAGFYVEQVLYGGSRRSGRGVGHSAVNNIVGSFTSYRGVASAPQRPGGFSQAERQPQRPAMARRGRGIQMDNVVVGSRAEADEVLDQLYTIIAQYEVAAVSDLYEMCGITSYHTDEKHGWTDLSGSSIRRVRGGGYEIQLPPPMPID